VIFKNKNDDKTNIEKLVMWCKIIGDEGQCKMVDKIRYCTGMVVFLSGVRLRELKNKEKD